MKHITLFFCDIRNTFLGSEKNEETDIKRFVINLERIKEKNKSQILVFIFSSEEIPQEIERVENHFMCFINPCSIELVKLDKKSNMKTASIIHTIKGMDQKYLIDEIYFADDCEIYHDIISGILFQSNIDVKFNSIITNKGGMIELNGFLEERLNKGKVKEILFKKIKD